MPESIPAPTSQDTQEGFSLVELLVALVFMALLMAGMAKVFQSSMNTFYRSSESISSGRRNRMAMDLLYDDLDAAGQYLTNLTAYPSYSANNPGFYILPNQPYTGTDVPTAQAITDELTFSFDEALPFEGRLYDPVAGVLSTSYPAQSNASRLANGVNIAPGALDTTMYVKFTDAAYASMVKDGMTVVFKDQWGPMNITGTTILASDPTAVSFKTQGGSDDAMGLPTGVNPLNDSAHFVGDGSLNPATGGAPVLFVQPRQAVRYLIKAENLDPANPTVGVPCLVRQQGAYAPGGFVSTTESIIAEDVTGFKVYLSAYPIPGGDPAKTWAGWGLTANDFGSGWTNGILAAVNTQLASLQLPSSPDTSDPNWFRNTPLLVRVDLTTRSTVKRAENSATGTIAAYQQRTQTLYMLPRYFGLSFN